jgi:hypothetical protein
METLSVTSPTTLEKNLVQAARELGPLISQNINEEEANRRPSKAVLDELRKAGFFRLFLPKSHYLYFPLVPDFQPGSHYKSLLYQFPAIGACVACLLSPLALAVARNGVLKIDSEYLWHAILMSISKN